MRRIAVALAALVLAAGASPVLAGGGTPKLTNIDAGPHLAELSNDSPSLMTGSNTLTVQIRDLPADHAVLLTLEGPNGGHVAVPLTRVTVLGDLEDDHHSHAEDGDDHSSTPADAHAAPVAAHVQQPTGDSQGATTVSPQVATDSHASMTGAAMAAHDGHGTPATPAPARPAPVADTHAATQPADAQAAPMAGHSMQPADNHAIADVHATDEHGAQTAQGHNEDTGLYLARGSVSLPSTGTWVARLVIRDPHGDEVFGETPLAVTEGGPSKVYLGFTGSLIFGSMLFGLIQRRRTDRALITKKGR
ncbi:MAG: hypothetical protein IT305_24475, partial [Chloroflexi bacterium]|nr:hypothetical protein [Chloroflexota bacterium]